MLEKIINDWLATVEHKRFSQSILEESAILATDVGLKRSENQDRIAILRSRPTNQTSRPFICAVVSDGMGGMLDGAGCATMSVAAFFASLIKNPDLHPAERLFTATADANNAVFQLAKGKGGATLSAVLVDSRGEIYSTNVGDSRIYVLAANRHELVRVTTDDTLQEAFGGQGRELVQFIGVGPALLPRVEQIATDPDSLFITSDGVHYIDHELLVEIIRKAGDPRRATERMVALARWMGGPDNASVAAFRPSDLLLKVTESSASPITIWSGGAQLQLAYLSPEEFQKPKSMLLPEANEDRDRNTPYIARLKKAVSKGRKKKTKSSQSEKQLEIKIETDDDASDR